MKSPAVSVILPVYNPGEGIRKCIHMLRTQTLSDIEMLFVDDCGSDGSMDAVREAAAADHRIRILTNPENLGTGASRNRGIEEAKGDYLSFIDPDDYPERDFLELLYKKAIKTRADIVKGERLLIDEEGKEIREKLKIPLNTSIRFGLHVGGQIYDLFSYNHWTAIYRRDFLLDHGIRYGLTRNSQDTTFLLRAGKYAHSICFEDRAHYCYVSRENSRMRDFSQKRLENELEAIHDQIIEMMTCDSSQYSFYKYIIGKIQYLLRLQAATRLQDEDLAEWFFREIKRMALELPWIDQIMEINQTVRGLVLYDANLSLIPYRAQGVDNGIEEWMDVVTRVTDFLRDHPEVGRDHGWMLRRSYCNVLFQMKNRNVSEKQRREVARFLKKRLAELPEPELLTDREPLVRIFLKTGMNLVPENLTIRTLLKRTGMNAMSGYYANRDKRRTSIHVSD